MWDQFYKCKTKQWASGKALATNAIMSHGRRAHQDAELLVTDAEVAQLGLGVDENPEGCLTHLESPQGGFISPQTCASSGKLCVCAHFCSSLLFKGPGQPNNLLCHAAQVRVKLCMQTLHGLAKSISSPDHTAVTLIVTRLFRLKAQVAPVVLQHLLA